MKVTGISARFVAPYAIAAMPARYAFERGAWQEGGASCSRRAAPIRSSRRSPISRAASARRAAATSPRRGSDAEQLETLHKALLAAKNSYWATEVEVQRLAAAGWIALGEGKSDEALKFMRAAADLEDQNEKHIVTPGRIVPARELLGDMLLEMKQPDAGAARVRGVADARAEPLPQLPRRGARGRDGRRQREGGRLLPEAASRWRRTPTRCGPSS